VWARVPGDLVFSVGVATFAIFVLRAFLAARVARGPVSRPLGGQIA
jgi:nitric oxide reductase large subunit